MDGIFFRDELCRPSVSERKREGGGKGGNCLRISLLSARRRYQI